MKNMLEDELGEEETGDDWGEEESEEDW